MPEISPEVKDLLNAQTSQISWDEVARHFARGVVVRVEAGQDLLHVAEIMVRDSAPELELLFESGQISRAQDDDAKHWSQQESVFWAVVVAPWVLVQAPSILGYGDW